MLNDRCVQIEDGKKLFSCPLRDREIFRIFDILSRDVRKSEKKWCTNVIDI